MGEEEFKTDCKKKKCTFEVSEDIDIEARLNEIAKTNDNVKGWEQTN